MSTRLKKVNAYVLLVVMMFAAVFANANMVFAKEDTSMQPENAVTYNETNTEATVQFDVTKVSDRWQVSQLISENGENGDDEAKENILYDRNDEALSNPKPVFTANENGTYKFRVKYASKAHSSSNGASANSDEQSGDDDGEAPTGKLKEKVFKVKVDGIAEKSEAASSETAAAVYSNSRANRVLDYSDMIINLSNKGSDITGDGSLERPFKTMRKAEQVIKANNHNIRYGAMIQLLSDIEMDDTFDVDLYGRYVLFFSYYPVNSLKRANAFNGSMINVKSGNTLLIAGVNIDGASVTTPLSSYQAGGITVQNGAKLDIRRDMAMRNHTVTGTKVAAALMVLPGGEVCSNKAQYTNNIAMGDISAAMTVAGKGAFSGGLISYNQATLGAVYISDDVSNVKLDSVNMNSNMTREEFKSKGGAAGITLSRGTLELAGTTTLTNNKGVTLKGGINVSGNARLYIGDSVNITRNYTYKSNNLPGELSNIHKTQNGSIIINKALTGNASIGIRTEQPPAADGTIKFADATNQAFLNNADKVFKHDNNLDSKVVTKGSSAYFATKTGPEVKLNAAEAKVMSPEQAKRLTNMNQLKEYMGVTATVNGQNAINNVSVECDESKDSNYGGSLAEFQQGKPGGYKINFKLQNEVKSTLVAIFSDDYTGISNSGNAFVTAHNREITPDQFKTLTTDSAINVLMGASGNTGFVAGKSENGKDVILSTKKTPMTAVKPAGWDAARQAGKEGTYKIKFHNGLKGNDYAEITVVLTVKSSPKPPVEGGLKINADSVFVTQSQAKKLTDADAIKTLMNAKATSADGKPLNCELTLIGGGTLDDIKSGKIGTYEMNFTASYGISQVYEKRYLTIVADDISVSNDKKHTVDASSVIITQTQAKKLAPSVTDDELIELNSAKGQQANDKGEPTKVTPKVKEIKSGSREKIAKGEMGTYQFTYYLGENGKDNYAEKTVNVTVVADGTVTDGEYSVDAKDATVKSSETKTFTDSKKAEILIAKLQATAKTVYPDGTVKDVTPQVSISDKDWNNIKSGKAGSYAVTFKNGNQSKKAILTVEADDVRFETKEVKFISESEASIYFNEKKLKELFEFHAYRDNEEVTDEVTVKLGDIGNLTTIVNHYITFEIGGQSKKVLLVVYPSPMAEVSKDHDHAVSAESATVSSSEFKKLTSDKLKSLIHAKSFKINNGTDVVEEAATTVTPAGFAEAQKTGKLGVYEIKAHNGMSGNAHAERKVYLKVIEDGAVSSKDGKNVLNATSAILTQSQAKDLGSVITDNILKEVNKVKAESMVSDGIWFEAETDVTDGDKDARDKIAEGKVGNYTFTYSIGNKGQDNYAAKTVSVIVVSDDGATDGKNSVDAQNGFVKISEAKTFTDNKKAEILIEKLKASAYTILEDGTIDKTVKPEVSIANDDWNDIKAGTLGEYSVTFKNGSLSKTVTLKVVADDTIIGNAVIESKTVKLLNQYEKDEYTNEEMLKELFEVKAHIDGKDVTDQVEVEYDIAVNSLNYDVTFKIGGESKYTSLHIFYEDFGTVSKDHEHAVLGENKTIKLEEFRELTESQLRKLMVIRGFEAGNSKLEDMEVIVETPDGFEEAQKFGTIGVYPIKIHNNLTGDAYVERTVNLTVKDGSISPNGKNMIKASALIINQSKVKEIGGVITDKVLMDLNKVTAQSKGTDGVWQDVTPKITDGASNNRAKLARAELGTYEFTYSLGVEGKSDYAFKTVSIAVVSDDTATDGKYAVSVAREFAFTSESHAKNFDDENKEILFRDGFGAKAMTALDDGTIDTKVIPTVHVSESDWNDITSGISKEYPIEFRNGTQSKRVIFKVVRDDAIIEDGMMLEAQQLVVMLQKDLPANIDDEVLKNIFGVSGYVDGQNVTDRVQVEYDSSTITSLGRHPVKFILNGKVKESILYVVDKIENNDEMSDGNGGAKKDSDATITSSDFKNLTPDKLISMLGTDKILKDKSGEEEGISIRTPDGYETAQKNGTPGIYPITLSNGGAGDENTQITEYLTVKEDGTEISENGTNTVKADNVTLTQNEVKKLDGAETDKTLNAVNKVLAETKVSDGEWDKVTADVTADADSREKFAEAVPGTYEFTYSIGDKGEENYTAKTVSVTVEKDDMSAESDKVENNDKENTEVGDNNDNQAENEYTLNAENGFVKEAEAKKFTDDKKGEILIEKLKATENANVSISDEDWNDIKSGIIGEYDVTFENATQSKTVTLKVIADNALIKDNVVIEAQQMVMIEKSALPAELNSETLKSMFGIKGYIDGKDATSGINVEYDEMMISSRGRHTVQFILNGQVKEVTLYVV